VLVADGTESKKISIAETMFQLQCHSLLLLLLKGTFVALLLGICSNVSYHSLLEDVNSISELYDIGFDKEYHVREYDW
jgi:hypothetical protein